MNVRPSSTNGIVNISETWKLKNDASPVGCSKYVISCVYTITNRSGRVTTLLLSIVELVIVVLLLIGWIIMLFKMNGSSGGTMGVRVSLKILVTTRPMKNGVVYCWDVIFQN